MKQAVIIPTLNPTQALVALADELIASGVDVIIIVNDGSTPAHAPIFAHVGAYEQITVLNHPVNRGKGCALKTAFAYCLKHHPDLAGVVTADDDGQHAASDIHRVAAALGRYPDALILGARDFVRANTPARSYLGNNTVNHALRLLYGLRLTDSQTGLRGIPFAMLSWMAGLHGDRYEFEINMLIQAARKAVAIKEVPIQLLYFDNNKASHYKTIRDTLFIVRILWANLFNRPASYGLLFHVSRFVLRCINRKLTVSPNPDVTSSVTSSMTSSAASTVTPAETSTVTPAKQFTEPVVYIARHRNLKGVLDVMMWYKEPLRCWVLDVFCDRKRCFEHYAHFTLTARYGWPKLFAYPAAFIFSLYVSALMRSMRAIPVYRSSLRQMKITLDLSVEALINNENLIIFPDVDYTSESSVMGDMYSGFINLDKPYRAKTGRPLRFVPLRVDTSNRRIEVGTPAQVTINESESFAVGKKRVLASLQSFINQSFQEPKIHLRG